MKQSEREKQSNICVIFFITIFSSSEYLVNRQVPLYIACSWAYSLAWALPPLVGWSSYDFEAFGTSCSIHWVGKSAGDISYSVALIVFEYGTCIELRRCQGTKSKRSFVPESTFLNSPASFVAQAEQKHNIMLGNSSLCINCQLEVNRER